MTLEFEPASSCERCARGEGCGAGAFSRLFARQGATLTVKALPDFSCGDRVRVGVDERSLLTGSLHLYGWPLLAFLVGLVVAHGFLSGTPLQEPGALATGLMAAFLTLHILRKRSPGLNPVVERLSCSRQSRST